MMDPTASRLLDAIKAFEQAHAHEPQLRPLLDALRQVGAEVEKIPGAAPTESPGMRAAREATDERAAPAAPGGAPA
jgi:hypothetical protein